MTLLESDARARSDSLDIRRSFIVQAPAGSGKTTLLIQRYLKLLASVDEPEAILAMTFTRKAAGEMLARVEQALKQASEPESSWPTEASKRETLQLARLALNQAQLRGWRLHETPGRLRIQTIDGVHRSLAAAVPISAGGAGQLSLAMQPMVLYREVARRTLREAESDAEWAAASGRLFEHLDNSWARLEDLLANMLAQRARWLPHLVGRPLEDLTTELVGTIRRVLLDLEDQLATIATDVARNELLSLARHAASNLYEGNRDAELLRHLQPLVQLQLGQPWTLEQWRAAAHFVLVKNEKDGTSQFRSAVTVNVGFGPKDSRKSDFQRWLAEWESAELAALLGEARHAPPLSFDESDSELLQSLVTILLLAAGQLELAFRERGEVDFIGVAAAAREALQEAADENRERVLHQGSRLQHVLIDEFQDTSRDQFELILGLTRDWQTGDGRTVFVVGDPMQSIYQFREARVDLFEAVVRDGFGALKLEMRSLARNFRSLPSIVDYVNDTFTRVFPARFDPRESAIPFSRSFAARDAEELPPALPSIDWRMAASSGKDGDSHRWETEQVLDCVQRWRQDPAIKSIAILVAARHHATPMVAALREAGHAVRGVDLVPLAETSVVQDLIALTRAVSSVLDRAAWLAVLRAPWCGLTLADLTVLVEDSPHAAVAELWDEPLRLARLSIDGRTRLARLRNVVAPLLARTDLSLVTRVESLWLQLLGPGCYSDEGAIDDARRYLDALADASRRPDWRASNDLGVMLDGLYAAGSSVPGAVEVMTIHRAKGLEFDAVIVPGLARRVQNDPQELLELVEWQEQQQAWVLFGPISATDNTVGGPSVSSWIRRLRSRRIDRERARLLYVAMTRAKRHLALIACFTLSKHGEASIARRSPLGVLRPSLEERISTATANPLPVIEVDTPSASSFGLKRWPIDAAEPVWPKNVDVPTLNLSSTELDADPQRASGSGADSHARALGIVIHRELERLAQLARLPADVDDAAAGRWRSGLLLEGVPGALCDEYVDRVQVAIRRSLQDPRGRWILSRHGEEDGIELALTGREAGRVINVVIDRCFVDDGIRWVIDYKTAVPSTEDLDTFLNEQRVAHRAQLERYASLLSRLGPQPLRAALYFPALGQFVELD